MAMGSNQPLTEMSTRNLPVDKEWSARKTDNLTAICEPIVYELWEPRRLTTLWAFTACYRDSFTIFIFKLKIKLATKGRHHFYQLEMNLSGKSSVKRLVMVVP
jgi:hypothetical protein